VAALASLPELPEWQEVIAKVAHNSAAVDRLKKSRLRISILLLFCSGPQHLFAVAVHEVEWGLHRWNAGSTSLDAVLPRLV
jgi:hypothetical protein